MKCYNKEVQNWKRRKPNEHASCVPGRV